MPNSCRWCGKALTTSSRGSAKLYCSDAHRAAFKRVEKAAVLATLVENLGPHVDEGGIFIYKELVDHLAGRVQEQA